MSYNFVTNLAHLWQFVVGSKGRKKDRLRQNKIYVSA
jgi:hypothetical protein